jgi:hypothetical protein
VTDRLIRITTALAVVTVAAVAAVISYRHAYELVSTHGESGLTARLVPFTVDGLILAASLHRYWPAGAWVLGSSPQPVPTWRMAWATGQLGRWSAPGPRWRWPARSSS